MRFRRNKNNLDFHRVAGLKRSGDGSETLPPHKGVYLLPNLFTTSALFSGFYGIVQAINGNYSLASIAIFIALVFDVFDGRVARLTNTQSAFGAEYDSLADMVSFGVAPALIVYLWSLHALGKIGWAAAFVYVACAALRLARFNTKASTAGKSWFQGLPSPAAAALVSGFVWAFNDAQVTGSQVHWLAWGITFFVGLTMVSSIPYFSGKEFHFKKSVPFLVLAMIPIVFVLASQDPPKILFALFSVYALSGYVVFLFQKIKGYKIRSADIQDDQTF